jgi:hypothetical protein
MNMPYGQLRSQKERGVETTRKPVPGNEQEPPSSHMFLSPIQHRIGPKNRFLTCRNAVLTRELSCQDGSPCGRNPIFPRICHDRETSTLFFNDNREKPMTQTHAKT